MRKFVIPLLILITAGCAQMSPPTPAMIIPTATQLPSSIFPTLTPSHAFYDPAPGIGQLPEETATSTPSARTYKYAFPVQPANQTSYAPGVSSHGYPAIDIFAPRGAEFVAVTSGVVDFVATEDLWEPTTDEPALRGGLALVIIGDDGVRYYGSHLSEIEPGIEPGVHVLLGQLLGRIGNTGNARGKDAHLHFGISHPTFPGDWKVRRGEIDPFSYLEAWRIGIDIRPQLPLSGPMEISPLPDLR